VGGRFFLFVLALGAGVAIGAWLFRPALTKPPLAAIASPATPDDSWIDRLYSQNPTEAAEATGTVQQLGAGALPAIRKVLQDPNATRERQKAALKACGLLGPAAQPALSEVAAALSQPELTSEAAVALSFMGAPAFPPLQAALDSEDPAVRRESLRSIGKLKERAGLNTADVLPLLVQGIADPDPGVRSAAATYLGIVHEGDDLSVPALIEGLKDPDPEVRRVSAAALASFGDAAKPALPALRKATGDSDPEVAREAGVTLVKLSSSKRP
jgi:HEAT repeat protein